MPQFALLIDLAWPRNANDLSGSQHPLAMVQAATRGGDLLILHPHFAMSSPVAPQPKPRTPKEWKAWLFFVAGATYSRLIPGFLRRLLEGLLVKVSPTVPESLATVFAQRHVTRSFVSAYVTTFLLCFGVVRVWSHFSGTWSGADTTRLYLVQDRANLLNYTLICPLYVALGSALVTLMVQEWARLDKYAVTPQPVHVLRPRWTSKSLGIPVIVFIAMLVAGLSTASYVSEALNSNVYPKTYWFIETQLASGERILGAFGTYYAVLNFSLLLFSLLILAVIFSGIVVGLRIGDSIHAAHAQMPMSIADIRIRLRVFTYVYILGKLLAATYMMNAFTWKWERPQGSINLIVLGGVLTFFGVYFISVPRYYIELQWHTAKAAYPQHFSLASVDDYDDIRPWTVRNIAGIVDTLIIGGFVTSFWA